ncbi:MAG: Amylo-alpha-1,6-glucosidase [Bacteroidetes bacterium ADurb.Bin037]|nr:MAG: Amylo-alpha-1,6-glucosidase [Bacteroidetes bacterium ADurb.Bin037]HPW77839.1 amylo-alpha-1,6-glucosidase [Bacteroidales bacterium]HQB55666.1 amylo-alpha-1,6-glucosidase [Bacteroidales bacterium]
MAYLQFNKHELGNLEYSLSREILSTNRAGGYLNTTLTGCNTRKYHGLLVVPIDALGGGNYILLSSLDETLIQHDQPFNLGIHRYPGIYDPRGHKYIIDFEMDKNIVLTYRIGGMIFRKEVVFLHNKEQLLIRYTLLEAHSPTSLRLKPFLAFRNVHDLTRANLAADIFHSKVEKGVGYCLYGGFPRLYMQLNVLNEFVSFPDWYKNIEYLQEKIRGYDYREDLFVPGYFECPIRKGQSIVFSASLTQANPSRLKCLFDKEISNRPSRDSYRNCLKLSASQFLINRNGKTRVVAGYPWLGMNPRDTAIALPGLTLSTDNGMKLFTSGLDTLAAEESTLYGSADAPLWFFWTLQQYLDRSGDKAPLWKKYGKVMKSILHNYIKGTGMVKMHPNGLIWAEKQGVPVTWMDSMVDGKPVNLRTGYIVEVCALWYNAVCFALELAKDQGDTAFVTEFEDIPGLVKENFLPTFWCESRSHLVDYVDHEGQNIFTRPNQIIACSLPFTPLGDETINSILEVCRKELLTPRGIRTLSPKNPLFEGHCEGDPVKRNRAYHQGSAWPWLMGPYLEAQFRLHGKGFASCATEMLNVFEEDMTEHGIGSIAELYDGDPPHRPHGCTSSARNVAEILRLMNLVEKYNKL